MIYRVLEVRFFLQRRFVVIEASSEVRYDIVESVDLAKRHYFYTPNSNVTWLYRGHKHL